MFDEAKKQQRKDLKSLKNADKIKMIQVLRDKLPEELKIKIIKLIKNDPKEWFVSVEFHGGLPHPFHLREGMGIRNLLRTAGFDEKTLGILNLDNVYTRIVEESLKEIS